MITATDNLLQSATRPTWYDLLPAVDAAMVERHRIYKLRIAANWQVDDSGWYGPHPATGELVPEADWDDATGLPLPEDLEVAA